MMQKLMKKLISGCVSLLLLAAMALPAFASSFDFSVSPILPANQREGSLGYFDLIVTPGQKQDLNVTVTNPTSEEIVVKVEAITASTNRNGIINYTTPGVSDEATLKYSLADIMTVREPVITVPPMSNKDITVQVVVPDEPFDGILLGSIFVLKEVTQAERDTGNAILNQYSYVVAVRVSQNDNSVPVDFVLGDVEAGLDNGKATIITNIRNPQSNLVKNVSVTSRVYPVGSDAMVIERINNQVNFAPNSVFEFSLQDQAGYGLQAGQYVAKVDMEHEGRTWNFEQVFEIKQEQAEEINQNAVNQAVPTPAGGQSALRRMPVWLVVVVSIFLVIVLGVLVVLFIVWKNNRAYKKYYEDLKKKSSH